MAPEMTHATWSAVVKDRGWTSILIAASSSAVTCNAETEFCVGPDWLSASEFPTAIQGARYIDVRWKYSEPLPSGALPPLEHPPHLVYVPQQIRSSRVAFTELHERCLSNGLALLSSTSASTPNLQVVVILVAAHLVRDSSASTASHPRLPLPQPLCSPPHLPQPMGPITPVAVAQLSTAAVGQKAAAREEVEAGVKGLPPTAHTVIAGRDVSSPAVRRHQTVFFVYFLPLKPGRDLSQGQPYNAWWKRRLRERRKHEKDLDVALWRDDLRQLGPRQPNGLPDCERFVAFQGYWDWSSEVGRGSEPPGLRHCCQVTSVPVGQMFLYTLRPWWHKEDDVQCPLEPTMTDQMPGFLHECDCHVSECGKLTARRELKQLREAGVRVALAVRRGGRLGLDQLGVFAEEAISSGMYLFEYVGIWLPPSEPEKREALYEPAGLHYLYDLNQRYELHTKPKARCNAKIGGGDVGGGGGGSARDIRKRRGHGGGGGRCECVAAECPDVPVVVDATSVGNVARFVNHRCEGANLESVNVCMGDIDATHMTIMMRAVRDISPGEELTLDYQAGQSAEHKDRIRAQPKGMVPCRCGAAKCLGFVFPDIHQLGRATKSAGARRNALGTPPWLADSWDSSSCGGNGQDSVDAGARHSNDTTVGMGAGTIAMPAVGSRTVTAPPPSLAAVASGGLTTDGCSVSWLAGCSTKPKEVQLGAREVEMVGFTAVVDGDGDGGTGAARLDGCSTSLTRRPSGRQFSDSGDTDRFSRKRICHIRPKTATACVAVTAEGSDVVTSETATIAMTASALTASPIMHTDNASLKPFDRSCGIVGPHDD